MKAKRPKPNGKAIARAICDTEDAPEVLTGAWVLEEAIRRGYAVDVVAWAAGVPRDFDQSARLVEEALDASLAPSRVELKGEDEGLPKYLRAQRGWVPTMTASSEDLAYYYDWLAEHNRQSTCRYESGDELGRMMQRHAAKTPARLIAKLAGAARQRAIDLVRRMLFGDEPGTAQRAQSGYTSMKEQAPTDGAC